MELQTLVLPIAVIIGIVNGVQLGAQYVPSLTKLKGFFSFVLGVLLGLLFGLLHWFGLPSVELGLLAGLSSSGLFKLTQNLGGK